MTDPSEGGIPVETWFHAVSLISERCKGCTNCIKRCPTEAIRVHDGKARIDGERCIDCGECIRICENHAKQASGDSLAALSGYRFRVAIPAPALMAQFQPEVRPEQILGSLLGLGFDRVVEAGWGADLTTMVLQRYLKEHSRQEPRPLISSSCPAVVRLIQVRFPGLIHYLAPIEAPLVSAAKLARAEIIKDTGAQTGEIGVFFISPCPAKITMIKNHYGIQPGVINGAISIRDVYGELQKLLAKSDYQPLNSRLSFIGAGWAGAGGESRALGMGNILAVDGIHQVADLLEEIELGQLNDLDYVEVQACNNGCVGGALTVNNSFTARMRLNQLLADDCLPQPDSALAALVDTYYNARFFESDYQVIPKPFQRLDQDLNSAMEKVELIEAMIRSLPGLDCGSCGSPNCRALAEDIILGKAHIFDCVFKLREELSRHAQELLLLAQRLPPAMGTNLMGTRPRESGEKQ